MLKKLKKKSYCKKLSKLTFVKFVFAVEHKKLLLFGRCFAVSIRYRAHSKLLAAQRAQVHRRLVMRAVANGAGDALAARLCKVSSHDAKVSAAEQKREPRARNERALHHPVEAQ